ncbi:30S ribosomal protein S9 [Lujinxingia vulgaris]|uniref:Small ribosomal subunit protein uS9 n=2 Tax=Lujinxingia TaxID=2653226 RepID=A0A5C6X9K6_9DELT|nr:MULTISPECIES: 30S ribosomal protein S9 [Lujinxingia]RDV38405.1 30S ribosomal protein S9 [Bradymonadaceae bacterium TMQ3]RVU42565.1 30S ribosomal protein S9 [Lujinxingia sediminis]TXC76824.1 30S ribosomal protein S9 [Bradymonadales bacterium TMQ1]TXD38056.1 30S ribosomal protein S9 [Lujinxingia vulgaris]
MAQAEQYHAIGRRKKASARVFLRPGAGKVTVNGQDADEYFARDTLMMILRQPLELTETLGKFDLFCTVQGGGKSGQAEAIKLGVARALLLVDGGMREPLKRGGFLTRDARVKERKKYGQKGARARFQFSKR